MAKFIEPRMIYGYNNGQGIYLKDTRISNMTKIERKENLIISDNVFIGHFNHIDASNGVTIEEGCQITNYVSILTHSSHLSIRLYGKEYRSHKNHKGYIRGKVHLGKYTFVGPHSVIMPNTRIGKGCIVSAYSFIKGDFPDFSIIKGNPAEVVGSTKELDEQYLQDNPDLKVIYDTWSQE